MIQCVQHSRYGWRFPVPFNYHRFSVTENPVHVATSRTVKNSLKRLVASVEISLLSLISARDGSLSLSISRRRPAHRRMARRRPFPNDRTASIRNPSRSFQLPSSRPTCKDSTDLLQVGADSRCQPYPTKPSSSCCQVDGEKIPEVGVSGTHINTS
jgi:hypothetical protein